MTNDDPYVVPTDEDRPTWEEQPGPVPHNEPALVKRETPPLAESADAVLARADEVIE